MTRFICMKRFKRTQVWMFDQKAWRCRNKIFQRSKSIYWVFKYNEWCLWEYWWLQPKQTKKILIVFDNMVADIMTNKTFQGIVKELFIRCRKLNISLVFITRSYFSVPKGVRVNSTHYLITKINNRIELQNIAINHSGHIDYNFFWGFTENAQDTRIIFCQLIQQVITSKWSFKILEKIASFL